MRRRLTPEERAARIDRRASVKAVAQAKVAELRQWRQARAEKAAKATRAERLARLEDTTRGVHRVPKRLQGLTVTDRPHLVGKHGTVLARPEDRHPAGNYAARHARGQRGKPRKPRRRELPGAVERRLQRAQREWMS